MKHTSLTSVLKSTTLSALIALSASFATPAWAQEKISVGSVNGEPMYLDEVMQLTEQLPDEYRRQPLESYYPNLVAEIANTKLGAKQPQMPIYKIMNWCKMPFASPQNVS